MTDIFPKLKDRSSVMTIYQYPWGSFSLSMGIGSEDKEPIIKVAIQAIMYQFISGIKPISSIFLCESVNHSGRFHLCLGHTFPCCPICILFALDNLILECMLKNEQPDTFILPSLYQSRMCILNTAFKRV